MNAEAFSLTRGVLLHSLAMILSGSLASLALQVQAARGFKHALTSCQQMFLAEALALPALVLPLLLLGSRRFEYFVDFRNELAFAKFAAPIGILRAGLGGILDLFASGLELLALALLPMSYYALLKNGSVIFTAAFTVALLKKPLFRHHWLGVALIVLGLFVIAAASLVKGERLFLGEAAGGAEICYGVLAMALGQAFASLRLVYQEYLFRAYAVDPRRVVGSEGVLGAVAMSFVLVATSLIPCGDANICEVGFAFDSPGRALVKMYGDSRILIAGLVAVFSILVFNVAGVGLTKLVSAVFRAMVDSLRTVFIWLLGWLFGLYGVDLGAFLAEFVGLVFLLGGNLIFSGYVEVGFLGLNKFVTNRRRSLLGFPHSR